MRKHAERGFSFIELMVVIVIIGLLTSVVALNVLPSQDRAMGEKARADVAILSQAVEMFRLENLRYPNMDDGLEALLPDGNRQGYIKALPRDPWGNEYVYLIPGENGVFDVMSLGADGRIGGEADNADIGNWLQQE
ncbi:MAG: type II secretion system major pseudopilin GspG [Alphaproteobacteria bacterium]|nr:type II secretion system major pseudopilin GspG [Alphaproteobacteria bacterium]